MHNISDRREEIDKGQMEEDRQGGREERKKEQTVIEKEENR